MSQESTEKIAIADIEQEELRKSERKERKTGVYGLNVLKRRVYLSISEIGRNLFAILQLKLQKEYEGKCSIEGYIKHNSIRLVTHSSGVVYEDTIYFDTVFECLVCCPVEGMNINNCVIKNITKAGIRAEISEGSETPVVIFVARDHHYDKQYFSTLKVDDIISVKVIGIRYELNDTNISVIANLIDKRKTKFTLSSNQ
jgi:DNA-directed RNA polymerase subunit E'/Rpb7